MRGSDPEGSASHLIDVTDGLRWTLLKTKEGLHEACLLHETDKPMHCSHGIETAFNDTHLN